MDSIRLFMDKMFYHSSVVVAQLLFAFSHQIARYLCLKPTPSQCAEPAWGQRRMRRGPPLSVPGVALHDPSNYLFPPNSGSSTPPVLRLSYLYSCFASFYFGFLVSLESFSRNAEYHQSWFRRMLTRHQSRKYQPGETAETRTSRCFIS